MQVFTVREAADATGLTYRRLDRWTLDELITPSVRPTGGRGVDRLFSYDDLVSIQLAADLSEQGFTPALLREIIPQIQAAINAPTFGTEQRFAVWDGEKVTVQRAEDLHRVAATPAYLIVNIDHARNAVAERIKRHEA